MKYLIIFLIIVFVAGSCIGQKLDQNNPKTLSVSQLSHSKWDNKYGIPYVKVPGANLGVTSFQRLNITRTAYLSDASNEIIIINDSGKIIDRFPVAIGPKDFIFEKDTFYVLEERHLTLYNKNGEQIKSLSLPNDYWASVRIARYAYETYLCLPSGNSIKINHTTSIKGVNELEGWITSSGNRVVTYLSGENSFRVKLITVEGKIIEKEFYTQKKVAGVFVVGCSSKKLVLDLQTFVSENPVSIDRFVLAVDFSITGFGTVSQKKLPDCYYVLSNKDIVLSTTGDITNLITSPNGLYLFSLKETTSTKIKDYPINIRTMKYHYNQNLLRVE